MSNLEIWDKHSDIDPKFTKKITGKDYSGTSPNAHHIIWCLTDLFGPVGVGFGWSVVADGIEAFGDTSIHWCRISFWHTDRSNTFEAYGQTKMAYMTRGNTSYLKVDEDAPKKSLTDAITKAAAQIGVASNIFLGRWDDNKYIEQLGQEFEAKADPELPAKKEKAKAEIGKAATVEKLNETWLNLEKMLKSDPELIKAGADRKAELEKPAASDNEEPTNDLDGDAIPY